MIFDISRFLIFFPRKILPTIKVEEFILLPLVYWILSRRARGSRANANRVSQEQTVPTFFDSDWYCSI